MHTRCGNMILHVAFASALHVTIVYAQPWGETYFL